MVGTASKLDSLKGDEVNVGGGGNEEVDGGEMSIFNAVEVDSVDDDGSLLVEDDAADSSTSEAEGVLNSTGLARGVAWILVMSFARAQ